MNARPKLLSLLPAVAWLVVEVTAQAQLNIPGANGTDGAFNPTKNTTIDLAAATSPGSWDSDNTANQGKGVYDPAKWAVVFKYSSVNIPLGVTVTFKNNASHAPVIWLVSGDVVIAGEVNLNGKYVATAGVTEPGPGGFRGGASAPGLPDYGRGFGPGGGLSGAGSYSTQGRDNSVLLTYGNTQIIPLIGGSGAPGSNISGRNGGGGGGAILIASKRKLTIDGSIQARSGETGNYESSGGAIRLIANQILGHGELNALSSYPGGGQGRIRIETPSFAGSLDIVPITIAVEPDSPPLIWPRPNAAEARVVSVSGKDAPVDPIANLDASGADLTMQEEKPIDIVIETKNLNIDAGAVTARVTPRNGGVIFVKAQYISGTTSKATWIATTKIPQGFAAIQVRAVGQ